MIIIIYICKVYYLMYDECCHKVRHPFERVVSAYQDKVIQDKFDWMDIEDLGEPRWIEGDLGGIRRM